MSSILRRSGPIVRLSRCATIAPCRTAFAPRLAPFPRQIITPRPLRSFATKPPKPPKESRKQDKETTSKADAKKEHSADGGTEHTSGRSKASPAKSDQKDSSEPEAKPRWLPPAYEKPLDQAMEWILKGLPEGQAKWFRQLLEEKKRHGISPELEEELKRVERGERMDLARIARITRLINKEISEVSPSVKKRLEEASSKTSGEQKSAHDPGPAPNDGHRRKPEMPKKDDQGWTPYIIMLALVYALFRASSPADMSKDITWQEFRSTFLDKGLVEKVEIVDGQRAKVFLHREAVASTYPESPGARPFFFYYFNIGSVESFERNMNEAQDALEIPPSQRIPIAYIRSSKWFGTLVGLLPHILITGLLLFGLTRGKSGPSGIFNMMRSQAKRYNHESQVQVKFSDVAGMDEAKIEIMEFVSFLKEPAIYRKLGAKIPRGAVLSGPPGTGKTLLAKATAGESGVPFFSVSGSEFVEMFVGVGASRVRDLFANARKSAPSIIFIDEIDAIGRTRSNRNMGGNDERESTLNQILTEMDGFNTSEQVVVMAGTNRADVLDSALLRPGRFDRQINIDRPTMEGRTQIFAVHLKKIVTSEDSGFLKGRLAALTPGFSGADIANCVNEAALIAARFGAESVVLEHFERAIERVIGGLEKKSLVLKPEEKRTVAYHEAGHAICGWYFRYADPLLKVSIIPRGQGALGYAQYLPSGDTYLMNVHQLMDRMAMILGGRVSEELHFDTVTSGASDDFRKVTQMASAMVTKWGMTKKIGFVHFDDEGQPQYQKPFSEETARNIDAEVKRIVDEAHTQCKDLLSTRKHEVGLVAEELLRKEVLSRDDMLRLLGPRPFEDPTDFAKYFSGRPDKGKGSVGPSNDGNTGVKGPVVPPAPAFRPTEPEERR